MVVQPLQAVVVLLLLHMMMTMTMDMVPHLSIVLSAVTHTPMQQSLSLHLALWRVLSTLLLVVRVSALHLHLQPSQQLQLRMVEELLQISLSKLGMGHVEPRLLMRTVV